MRADKATTPRRPNPHGYRGEKESHGFLTVGGGQSIYNIIFKIQTTHTLKRFGYSVRGVVWNPDGNTEQTKILIK
ncbi:MAG: hypothetical protein ACP6IP_04240 [Candidatus Njordarchaeia archaeon]